MQADKGDEREMTAEKTQNKDLRSYKQFLRICRFMPVHDVMVRSREYPEIIRIPLSQGV